MKGWCVRLVRMLCMCVCPLSRLSLLAYPPRCEPNLAAACGSVPTVAGAHFEGSTCDPPPYLVILTDWLFCSNAASCILKVCTSVG